MTGDGRSLADGEYVAVVDRFEERERTAGHDGAGKRNAHGDSPDSAATTREVAVLLVESDDAVVGERTVPAWRLPEDARQ